MKYVIINEDTPIMFPEHIDHCRFSEIGKVTSAGFCSIKTDELGNWTAVYGESKSLKIKPAKDDTILLELLLQQGKEIK